MASATRRRPAPARHANERRRIEGPAAVQAQNLALLRRRHRLPQNDEDQRRGPADQHEAVQRRHRCKQTPMVERQHVAISERRVVAEGEINEVGSGRRGADRRVGIGPSKISRKWAAKSRHPTVTMTTAYCRTCGVDDSRLDMPRSILSTIPMTMAWMMRFRRLVAPPARSSSNIGTTLLSGEQLPCKQVGLARDRGAPPVFIGLW